MEAVRPQPKEFRQIPEGKYAVKYYSASENLQTAGEYRPVIVILGWGITNKSQEAFCADLSKEGKDVNSLEFSRTGGKVEDVGDGFRKETIRKSEAFADYMGSLPEGKYDVFGQSEGTMVILAAIERNPEIADKIKNIVFMSPAGLGEGDNFVKLFSRYLTGHMPQGIAHFLKHPIKHKQFMTMNSEGTKYIGKNLPRALKEANAISHGGFYQYLEGLKARGVNVALVQGEQDKLTPAKHLYNSIGEGYPKSHIPKGDDDFLAQPPFHSVTMVGGGHDNRVYAEPGFAKKVVTVFNELDNMADNKIKWKRPDNYWSGANFAKWKKSKQAA